LDAVSKDIFMTSLYITTNKEELDLPLIHRYLSEQSTWAIGLPYALLQRAVSNSLCFGGFLSGRQVAFARVVTDKATFANLLDVFVLPEHRGNGYGKQLMEAILQHPDLQGLRRFTLATSDTHGLYAKYGFTAPGRPETLMERYYPNCYVC
jgi:GNAT superfamily N-acetyltransferase